MKMSAIKSDYESIVSSLQMDRAVVCRKLVELDIRLSEIQNFINCLNEIKSID